MIKQHALSSLLIAIARLLLPVMIIVSLCSASALGEAAEHGDEAHLSMLAINVSKADCILLTCGSSRYLVDTGTVQSWGAAAAVLADRGIDHLDGVIVTHTDKDHAGGAAALVQSGLTVDAWYASDYHLCKTKKHPLVKAAAVRGESVIWLSAGDTLPLDGGTLTVLAPKTASAEENSNSLVLLAESPDGSILLAGDMEFEEEGTILSDLRQVTVLKVANHGEADATSQELLSILRPQLAVISTDSSVEHDTPSGRVLSALKKYSIPMVCTQNSGNGILVTLKDGQASYSFVDLQLPAPHSEVEITDKSVAQDTVSLTNWGSEPVDLSGWYLLSERGSEVLLFPEGTILQPGASFTVSTLTTEDTGDLVWQEKRVWHETKDDTAILYDASGREISRLD